jgi:adenylate kinase family enzyme
LIDGFPRSLEQALYLDRHLKDMKVILNVYADDDVLVKRLSNRGKTSGRMDDADVNIIMDRINVFKKESFPAINFYQKYGIVRDINSNLDINSAYALVLENLLPEIYCVVGKRYSGKSTICKFLEKRIGAKIIDFNDFLREKNIE